MSLFSKISGAPLVPRKFLCVLKNHAKSTRARLRSCSVTIAPATSIPATRRPVSLAMPQTAAHVAIQNEDHSNDAVVISTLTDPPFKNHEDLLRMDRARLVHTAEILNARLPRVLNIDLGDGRSDAYIRNSIEILVGLREDRPQPRSSRRSISVSFAHPNLSPSFNPTPRTPVRPRPRPAHTRSRSYDALTFADRPGFGVGLYAPHAAPGARLEILEEAAEEDSKAGQHGHDMSMDVDPNDEELHLLRLQQRPQKKQRVLSPAVPSIRPSSSEFNFKLESPTLISRGFHKRMASFDEGRLKDVQALDGAAAAKLFGHRRQHSRRYRPKCGVGRTSTPKKEKENEVFVLEASWTAMDVSPPASKKRKVRELEEEDVTFGLDGLTIEGIEKSMVISPSEEVAA